MFAPKSFSHRKAHSSFINDSTDINLMHLSLNKEQRGPYTMTSNQESKTNFIGDSVIPTAMPRAFQVTKTGEKYVLDLDIAAESNMNSNSFAVHSPRFSAAIMEKICENSCLDMSLPATEKLTKNSVKLVKKPKAIKCHVNKKHRLIFTPRNLENTSLTELQGESSTMDNKESLQPIRTLSKNTETQTNNLIDVSCNSCKPRRHKTIYTDTNMKQDLSIFNPLTQDSLKSHAFYSSAMPPLEPLKIYTKTNSNLRKYAELRAIASVITLITVSSWLFSMFFDVECLWNYLDGLWQYFQNWFSGEEKPKTKIEMLIEFLQDLWS